MPEISTTRTRPISETQFYYFVLFIMAHSCLANVLEQYLALYLHDLGFAGVQIGVYFAITVIAPLIFSLPMGITTDRIQISSICMISFVFMALHKVGFLLSHSFWLLCGFALFGSFGGRFFGVAKYAMFFKITDRENSRKVGVFQLGRTIAVGLGTLLGGVLIFNASYRFVFTMIIVCYLGFILLAYFLPRTETASITIKEYTRAVLTPRVLLISGVFFLSSLHWGAEAVAYSLFLRQHLGLHTGQIGLYTGVGYACVGIGAYLAMLLFEHQRVRHLQYLLYAGLLLAGIGHILMCIPSVPWSFAFRLVHEIGDGFITFAFFQGVSKIFHLDKIGGGSAFISVWMMLGTIVGSIIFGQVGASFGYHWPLILSGIILAAIPVLLHTINDRLMNDQADMLVHRGEIEREAA
jgi:MFS family permease